MTYEDIKKHLINKKFQKTDILERFFKIKSNIEQYISPDGIFVLLLDRYDNIKHLFTVEKEGIFKMPSKKESRITFYDGGLIIESDMWEYWVFNPRRVRYYLEHYKLTNILGIKGGKKYRYALIKHPSGKVVILVELNDVSMIIAPAQTTTTLLDNLEVVKSPQGEVLFKEYLKYFEL